MATDPGVNGRRISQGGGVGGLVELQALVLSNNMLTGESSIVAHDMTQCTHPSLRDAGCMCVYTVDRQSRISAAESAHMSGQISGRDQYERPCSKQGLWPAHVYGEIHCV